MAKADQALQIIISAINRHAAHGNIFAQMFSALGQHNAKRPAGNFRILEEQLVEIAHPVKQQAVRIGRLDLDKLSHHRRDAMGISLGGGGGV